MKFVTLSSHRSGSSLFQRMLNSHPDILARQEDLRDQDRHPIEAMRKRLDDIFAQERKYAAVGFKVQYSHIRPWVLNYIKENGVRIIQLIRRDMLETVFWYPGNYEGETKGGFGPPLVVPEGTEIKAKVGNVIKSLRWIKKQNDRFKKMADFVLYYEDDLTGGKDVAEFFNPWTRKRLLVDFFDVRDMPLRDTETHQRKAKRKPLRELVINYGEMMEAIKKAKVEVYYEG